MQVQRGFRGVHNMRAVGGGFGNVPDAPPVGDFKVVGGGRWRLNLPTVSNTPPKGRRIHVYVYMYIYIYVIMYYGYMYICIYVHAHMEAYRLHQLV